MLYIVAAGPLECGAGFLHSWLNGPGKVDGRLKAATSSLVVRPGPHTTVCIPCRAWGLCQLTEGWVRPWREEAKGRIPKDTCQGSAFTIRVEPGLRTACHQYLQPRQRSSCFLLLLFPGPPSGTWKPVQPPTGASTDAIKLFNYCSCRASFTQHAK